MSGGLCRRVIASRESGLSFLPRRRAVGARGSSVGGSAARRWRRRTLEGAAASDSPPSVRPAGGGGMFGARGNIAYLSLPFCALMRRRRPREETRRRRGWCDAAAPQKRDATAPRVVRRRRASEETRRRRGWCDAAAPQRRRDGAAGGGGGRTGCVAPSPRGPDIQRRRCTRTSYGSRYCTWLDYDQNFCTRGPCRIWNQTTPKSRSRRAGL